MVTAKGPVCTALTMPRWRLMPHVTGCRVDHILTYMTDSLTRPESPFENAIKHYESLFPVPSGSLVVGRPLKPLGPIAVAVASDE